ncbi:MAG: MBL fold metallo-hydrolase [Spirochaetaceae bacterium]|jgi:phosphoribosyl 1,2-cyclic phosphodiesterase|nr:MBL fold metallo-hydrolase [Spirochaetaceae bacterium]
MRIHFWGVRGSLPSPQLPSQIKSKISSVLERLKPSDLESAESKERFLAELPPWLFGTIGGNTPCVSIKVDGFKGFIIFDSGSGLREMGIAMAKEKPKPIHYHLFYSHFHWDHIQGLPFFNPAYDPSVSVDFYSPVENFKNALCEQMAPPYFPAPMDAMSSKKTFHCITGKVMVNSLEISFKKMNHPGGSYAYGVNDGKHRFIYATDTELSATDFIRNDENAAFFGGVDIIALDSQYTLGEAIEKYNWGHSAFSMAVDFAANWGIKHVVLFHHDPTYDDRKLVNILQSARWYTERMGIKGIEISLATEGLELTL